MKILIVDDTNENLVAAREAAKAFPGNEFVFSASAWEAANKLTIIDAIITDLIFEEVPIKDMEIFHGASYAHRITKSDTFHQVVSEYYDDDLGRAKKLLEAGVEFAKEGTVTTAINKLAEYYRSRKKDAEASEALERLATIPLQFPFGGGLMIAAKKLGRKCCLVSNIHHHASNYKTAAASIDAMILLIPLIEQSVLTIEQAMYDGHGSLTYMGGDEIAKFGADKTDPGVWTEAIKRIMAQ